MQIPVTLRTGAFSVNGGDTSLPISMSASSRAPLALLLTLTALAVCVQGYHLGVDDAAIYVPGIKQAADPALYPFGAEFFQSHARLTSFPFLVGTSARLTGLPIDFVIFA